MTLRLPSDLDAVARWTTRVFVIGATAISAFVLGTANGLSTAVYRTDDVRVHREAADSLDRELEKCVAVQERAVLEVLMTQATFAAAWDRYRDVLAETGFDDLREVDR